MNIKLDNDLIAKLIEVRRQIHQNPELGFTEFKTTKLIANVLQEHGINHQILDNGVGVVANISLNTESDTACDSVGGRFGVCKADEDEQEYAVSDHNQEIHYAKSNNLQNILAFRADIDALPIKEETGLPFSSQIDGISHACGHDVHSVILLGVTIMAAKLSNSGQLNRSVRCIWQPAEEVHPSGAKSVISQGVLNGVSEIFALHCEPKLDVGFVGLLDGALTSATNLLKIELFGPGGHTSRPHLTADIVNALGELTTNLPKNFNKLVDPRKHANITFGHISAGNACNVIPSYGIIEGTLRTFSLDTWEKADDLIRKITASILEPLNVNYSITHSKGVPPVINHSESIKALRVAAINVLGENSVQQIERSLGAEDFAFMIDEIPGKRGAMARIGTRTKGGETFDIHQGNYIIDEEVISVGVNFLSALL